MSRTKRGGIGFLIVIALAVLNYGVMLFLLRQDRFKDDHRFDEIMFNRAPIRKPVFHQDAPIRQPVFRYPYEGWQPVFHQDNVCLSWRACFETDHNCTSMCRESLVDFGSPPPRPGFNFSNPNLTAQAIPWVPDVTILRRMLQSRMDRNGNPWPPPLVTYQNRELCEAISDAESDENKKLLDAVPVHALPLVGNSKTNWTEKKMKRAPKILVCSTLSTLPV